MTIAITDKDGTLLENTFLSRDLAQYLYTAIINFQTDENETIKKRQKQLFNELAEHEKECIHLIESVCEMVFFDGEDQ